MLAYERLPVTMFSRKKTKYGIFRLYPSIVRPTALQQKHKVLDN